MRMTAPHLKALQDSVGQARGLPARFAWDRKAVVHAEILNRAASTRKPPQPENRRTTMHETIDPGEPLVHDWRTRQLMRLGIPRPLAEAVADQVDWHQIAALELSGQAELRRELLRVDLRIVPVAVVEQHVCR